MVQIPDESYASCSQNATRSNYVASFLSLCSQHSKAHEHSKPQNMCLYVVVHSRDMKDDSFQSRTLCSSC